MLGRYKINNIILFNNLNGLLDLALLGGGWPPFAGAMLLTFGYSSLTRNYGCEILIFAPEMPQPIEES